MRIWSLHPRYLDSRGLIALWREGLLAQAVLRRTTLGYRRHPQLARFRACPAPLGFLGEYLRVVEREAARRGYRLTTAKISRARCEGTLVVPRGQLEFEWEHLLRKLEKRNPLLHAELSSVKRPRPHPLFRVVKGGVAQWERSSTKRKHGR